ncbi:hypothetical protein [Hymenobacter nivis]|uniref:HNH endonuclease n=1 Tax=Hymenobacter nivis TaxID=1850093 RepID=A0A502HEV3_9BACT|nr:hypothetical protein [Hymenobacter nivis]TPG72003.1 hypothetical protein EAH73_01795 [Hymenobacter nivis]
MPIDLKLYHPKWSLISRLVRYRRAGNKCEWCGAPNGQVVARGTGRDAGTYMLSGGQVFDATNGKALGRRDNYVARAHVKIILTVAHLDQDPGHNRFHNLAALCQRCHLNYDRWDNYRRRFHKGQFSLAL